MINYRTGYDQLVTIVVDRYIIYAYGDLYLLNIIPLLILLTMYINIYTVWVKERHNICRYIQKS